LFLLIGADTPDAVGGIIGYQHTTVFQYAYTYRPSMYFISFGIYEKAGEKVLGRACRLSILERDEDHFVSRELAAVPGSVLCNESAVAISFGECISFIESKSQ
jgi:hypothetical protein